MKICIFGAGAIGGYLGVQLAAAGFDVSLVARGAHLAAIKANGLTLEIDGTVRTVRFTATDDPASLGVQDYLIITLKAHSVPGIVKSIQPLLGPSTSVVSAVNGIPWWYCHGLDSPLGERHIEAVDPGGEIWRSIGPERALGCVVYPSAEIVAPGVVRHISDNKFSLGEPNGAKSERIKTLAGAFIEGGLKAPVRPRLRDEIWIKLWGNLSFNPLSALTGATLDTLATDPGTRMVARQMMVEAQAVGEKLAVRFSVDVDKRIAGAAAVGAHRTSMLQDLDLGRPLEVGALVESVQELGRLVELPTPTIDIIHALLTQRIAVRDAVIRVKSAHH